MKRQLTIFRPACLLGCSLALVIGQAIPVAADGGQEPLRFSGFSSGMKEAGQRVIQDAGTWEKVWKQVHDRVRPQPQVPKVNFEKQSVLAVFMGEKNSGGYSIQITQVKDAGAVTEVIVSRISPGARDVLTAVLTQPYDMLIIEKPAKPVKFVIKDRKRPDAHGVIVTFGGQKLNEIEAKTTNAQFRPEFEKRLAELVAQLPGKPKVRIEHWYDSVLNGCAIRVEVEPDRVVSVSKRLLAALIQEAYVARVNLY